MMDALAIHHVAPEKVSLGTTPLPAPGPEQLLIRARYSAISPGTESLIYQGRFPAGLARDGTIASLEGGFAYPFTYGYALVGEVIDAGAGVDPAWHGRNVFTFHPHQDHAVVPVRDAVPIPERIEPRTALFLPSMESALNFVMDAAPAIGEKVMVFGQGVVGLLTTALLAQFPLGLLVSADPIQERRERSLALGAGQAIDPGNAAQWNSLAGELFGDGEAGGLDLAFELSGNARALDQAIELAGFSGRIIVGSWYGSGGQTLDLGGHFHRRRIELISSQVSTVHPRLSGRWTKRRRIDLAWDAIAKLAPQRLITHSFSFRECQRAFALASARSDGVLQVVFEYR
jgi:2-desacetyl-2-hydroxyethyl bacteriochlorophyllide A dehydrogenase